MNREQGFAIWITGLPASGKSTIARELAEKLSERGVYPAVLESDGMRTILTPEPTYAADERNRFYRQLVLIGSMLTRQGFPVIFDATANLRDYRDQARARIPRFVEVYVHCPLEVCRKRDPKGIYAAAASGTTCSVPGIQALYEAPLNPEVTVDGQAPLEHCVDSIVLKLQELNYI